MCSLDKVIDQAGTLDHVHLFDRDFVDACATSIVAVLLIKRLVKIGEQILSLALIDSDAEGFNLVDFLDQFLDSLLVYLVFGLLV